VECFHALIEFDQQMPLWYITVELPARGIAVTGAVGWIHYRWVFLGAHRMVADSEMWQSWLQARNNQQR
jgi:hypothetical protein